MDAFDLGATLEEVARAVGVRYNLGPLILDLAMRPTEARRIWLTRRAGADANSATPNLVRTWTS